MSAPYTKNENKGGSWRNPQFPVRLARRLPDGHELLIVAITGYYSEPGGRAESFAAGIDWQLPKPAHPEALISLLKHKEGSRGTRAS